MRVHHLGGGGDVVELCLGADPVPQTGADCPDAQVLGAEDYPSQGDGPGLGQPDGLLPLKDGAGGGPGEAVVRLVAEVAQLLQGRLQLADVLAVVHARLKAAPGGQ